MQAMFKAFTVGAVWALRSSVGLPCAPTPGRCTAWQGMGYEGGAQAIHKHAVRWRKRNTRHSACCSRERQLLAQLHIQSAGYSGCALLGLQAAGLQATKKDFVLASPSKLQQASSQVASKQQAASSKQQAASSKQQAASSKRPALHCFPSRS